MSSSHTSLVRVAPPVAPLPPTDQVLCAVCGQVFSIRPSDAGVIAEIRCPHCEPRIKPLQATPRRSLQQVLGDGPRSMREMIVPAIASVVGLLLFACFLLGMRYLLRSNRLGHQWNPSHLAAQGEWPVPARNAANSSSTTTQSTSSTDGETSPRGEAGSRITSDSSAAARDVLTFAEWNTNAPEAAPSPPKHHVDPHDTVFDVARPIVANNLTSAQIHARIAALQGTIFPVQCRITAIHSAEGLRAPERLGGNTAGDAPQAPTDWKHRLEIVDVEQRSLQNVFVPDNESIQASLGWTRSGDWVVLMVTPGTAHDPLLHRVLWGLVVVDILPTPSPTDSSPSRPTEDAADRPAE